MPQFGSFNPNNIGSLIGRGGGVSGGPLAGALTRLGSPHNALTNLAQQQRRATIAQQAAAQRAAAAPLHRYAGSQVPSSAAGILSGEFRGVLNNLSQRLAQLEATGGGAMGGPVTTGSVFSNLAPYAAPPIVGKGGILELTFVTFAAAAVAGTTATAVIDNATRARLTNTVWEYAEIIAEGDLADVDELRKIQATASINGRPIPVIDRVSADVFAPGALARNIVPVFEEVGADSEVQCLFTVIRDLTTTAPAAISLRLYSGDGDTFVSVIR